MKDYYKILGLESNASIEQIKNAYRLRAKKFHPDKHKNDKFFEERFIEVREAYCILIDPNKKHRYDNELLKSELNRNESLLKKEQELKKKEAELRQKEYNLHNKQKRRSDFTRGNKKSTSNNEIIYFKEENVFISSKVLKVGYGTVYIKDIECAELLVKSNKGIRILGYLALLIGLITATIYVGIFILIMGLCLIMKSDAYIIRVIFKNDIDQEVVSFERCFAKEVVEKINQSINEN